MSASDREIVFLQRLALTAASALDANELMQLVISETTEALRVDVCSIYLLDPDGEHLLLTATNGLSKAGVGRVRLAIGEGITGWAAKERRPVTVEDVSSEPRFRWLPGVDQSRFVSMCSTPILSAGRLVGVVNVQTERRHTFSGAEVDLMQAIGAQVAGMLERSELQRRLEARVRELQLSDEIHRRLSQLALSGADIATICAAMERYTAAPAAVYDDEGARLAGSADDQLPSALRGFVDPERRDDGLLVAPVKAGSDPLGWIAVGPAGDTVGTERAMAIEHGRTVIALRLIQERAEAEAESRLRGGLLQELLASDPSPSDARRLAQRAARLGHRVRGPVRVLVVEADDADAAHALSRRTARRSAIRALQDLVARSRPGGLVVEHGADLVLLLPELEDALEEAEALAERARAAVAGAGGGVPVSAGVSAGRGGPEELSRLAREAREALRVGRSSGRRGAVDSYARLGIERLLLRIERRDELAAFAAEWIGPLEAHARSGRGAAPLVATLEALVAEGWSLRATARRLHVHINTLLYRITRIEELTGRELDDADTRMSLFIALKARALAGLDDPSEPTRARDRAVAPYPFGIDVPTVADTA